MEFEHASCPKEGKIKNNLSQKKLHLTVKQAKTLFKTIPIRVETSHGMEWSDLSFIVTKDQIGKFKLRWAQGKELADGVTKNKDNQ